MAPSKKGILERLREGPVVGDGGMVSELEKRCYVTSSSWTPEVLVKEPQAVRQLHWEFLRAGADVLQAFTFYASDDDLQNRRSASGQQYTSRDVNRVAVQIAREVADKGDALVAAGLSETPGYLKGSGRAAVQAQFQQQVDVFVENNVDFLVCEYFAYIEEIEWAIEVCKKSGKPVAATMRIGPQGDAGGVSPGECAVRMAKAGAEIVGVNCVFDPFISIETIKMMKKALNAAGLKPFIIVQPAGVMTPDAGPKGCISLPDWPLNMDSRVLTRGETARYARLAVEAGIDYIGACCYFRPYHIRAIAEEVAEVTGRKKKALPGAVPETWGKGLEIFLDADEPSRVGKEYWMNLKPGSGRPHCASCNGPRFNPKASK